jgi:hypothetical protein
VKEGGEEGAAAGDEAREGHGVGSGRVGSGGCGDEWEKRGRLQQIGLLRTARRTPACGPCQLGSRSRAISGPTANYLQRLPHRAAYV